MIRICPLSIIYLLNIGLLSLPLWFSPSSMDFRVAAFFLGASALCHADLSRQGVSRSADSPPATQLGRFTCHASGFALLVCFWLAVGFREPKAHSGFVASGLLMMLVGAAIRRQAVVTLGTHFVSRETPLGELRRDGIYAWIRHPSESGLLLASLGACVLLDSIVASLCWLIVLLPLSLIRTGVEERELADAFGDAHEAYTDSVPAYLPACRPRLADVPQL